MIEYDNNRDSRTFPSDIYDTSTYQKEYVNNIVFEDVVFVQRRFLFFKWIEKRIRVRGNITVVTDDGGKWCESFVYTMKDSEYEKLKSFIKKIKNYK